MGSGEPMELPPKGLILGIGISITDYAEVTANVVRAAQERRLLLVTACDVHCLIEAHEDPAFAAILSHFHIVTPDGQPVRWGLGWTGQARLADRVYGPTLTLHVCEAAAERGLPVYLYGSRPQTLERLSARLCERYPRLQIAGSRPGRFRPLTEQEQAEDAAAILESGARVVLVGMGCPRQDFWMWHMRERIALPMLAVGAAFDFHAGLVSQAPPLLQGAGLEWAYRLSREPRRLWRRYLVQTPRYLPLMAAQLMQLRDFARVRDTREADARPCPG